ncbi:MAG TPA: hypothetical protein VNW15_00780 [Rhizomicrobium sp.]|nr:hypothetical protein [Rhizomicrobium sp.]
MKTRHGVMTSSVMSGVFANHSRIARTSRQSAQASRITVWAAGIIWTKGPMP